MLLNLYNCTYFIGLKNSTDLIWIEILIFISLLITIIHVNWLLWSFRRGLY